MEIDKSLVYFFILPQEPDPREVAFLPSHLFATRLETFGQPRDGVRRPSPGTR